MNANLGPLAALFAAAFAVQQLLELLTTILTLDSRPTFQRYKKAILGVSSLIAGLILAYCFPQLQVLKILGSSSTGTGLDVCVTGLVLSAGTDGVNSILKFAKYSKEDKKSTVASKEAALGDGVDTTGQSAMLRLDQV
jgi:hypothetical protein